MTPKPAMGVSSICPHHRQLDDTTMQDAKKYDLIWLREFNRISCASMSLIDAVTMGRRFGIKKTSLYTITTVRNKFRILREKNDNGQ